MRTRHAAISAALFLATTAIAVPAIAQQTPSPAAASVSDPKPLQFGSWGVDLNARDMSVKPGDDFDTYANGGWKAKTQIPADQGSAGVGYDVYNLTQDQLRALVSKASADSDSQTWLTGWPELSAAPGSIVMRSALERGMRSRMVSSLTRTEGKGASPTEKSASLTGSRPTAFS